MNKELETLEKLVSFAFVMSENMIGLTKGNYDYNQFIKKTYDYLHKYNVDAKSQLELENALKHLESIENSNPSEALEDSLKRAFDYGVQSTLDGLLLRGYNTKTMLEEQCCGNTLEKDLDEAKTKITNLNTIKQALLKAQEQEKENARYKQLEEQLGCPLEVRERALTNGIYIKNIYGDMVNFKVMLVYKNKELGYYFRIINDGAVLLKDYKKTWFLKEDKSE